MPPVEPLRPQQLLRRCNREQLAFDTTAELDELTEAVGQARAIEALEFGIGMGRPGFHLYALGPSGTGKRSMVLEFLAHRAAREPAAADWCYVVDFDDPRRPRALQLPSGQAIELRNDMARFVEQAFGALRAVFESDDYRARLQLVSNQARTKQEQALAEVTRLAQAEELSLVRSPGGWTFVPLREAQAHARDPRHPTNPVPAPEQQVSAQLQQRLADALNLVPQWQTEVREQSAQIAREMAEGAVAQTLYALRQRYAGLESVVRFLDAVHVDLLDGAARFAAEPEASIDLEMLAQALQRYRVQVLVGHDGSEHAPIVYEAAPSCGGLVGTVESDAQAGTVCNGIHGIRAGALHRANGGYLLLEAEPLLRAPRAWDELKRCLRCNVIVPIASENEHGLRATALQPEAIPLDVKIVLLGTRLLYCQLFDQDDDFSELFSVAVDFEDDMAATPENLHRYARLLGTMVRRKGLLELDRDAVARMVEQGARVIEDSERISIHLGSIAELLQEADYWARARASALIQRVDVSKAVAMQVRRLDRLRERMQADITRGTVQIDTQGTRIGQVNGVSVLEYGGLEFGQPNRISATARLGEGDIVDIERETELGGSTHSKGVLILSAYLALRYSADKPLSLAASLVFEQSYAMIEGDSASLAELSALLSAVARTPLRQDLAVTGSVNQYGEVQAVGGVNEKIEGFFDICAARGLRAGQGVIIPRANVVDLMLREDLVQAAADGRFSVYAVTTVDEALELLTGMEAGRADESGAFPEQSFNRRVCERLAEFADIRQEFSKSSAEDGHPEADAE